MTLPLDQIKRLKPDVGGQPCTCPVLVSFLSWFFGKSCLVSVYCPDSVRIFCPDSVCLDFVRSPDSVQNFVKRLSDVYLSGFFLSRFCPDCLSSRTETRQRCPDFQCSCPPISGPSDVTLTLIISRICYRSSTDDCKNIWTCFGLFG